MLTTPDHRSVASLLRGDTPLGSTVTVRGWVRSRRSSKAGLSFIAIHDGSAFDSIQAVAQQALPNYDDTIVHIATGAAVEVTGELVESKGKGQSVEIQAASVTQVGGVDDPESYPIAKKRHTFEYLRSVAHLRPRTNTIGAITRLRATVANAIHNYYHRNGFTWVNTPLITASDCEGAGELFRVSTLDLANLPMQGGQPDFSQDFFGSETFLTVSGQLNVEAYCLAMSKVYTFGPTFRAENSNTSRHLAEFWMVEPEIAFADLDDLAALSEDFLKAVFTQVLDERQDDMAFFADRIDQQAITRIEQLVAADFERMDYSDAVRILKDSGKQFEFPVEWGLDLQSEHERWLTEEHVGRPVVVQNYPAGIKAFYMRQNDDAKTVAAMDVLVPGVGEIIGGSQREERLDVLDARMDALPNGAEMKAELGWYRDLRRYGTVPHAGFGLGLERLLMYISGMDNIRDVIPFPRVPNSAAF